MSLEHIPDEEESSCVSVAHDRELPLRSTECRSILSNHDPSMSPKFSGLHTLLRTFVTLWALQRARSDMTNVQYRLRYAITENQPDDLRIGKIDEDLLQTPEIHSSELFGRLQSAKPGLLRYTLREPSNYFQLDEASSVLSTRKSIDLESICPRFCREGSSRAQMNLFVNIWYNNRVITLLHVEITIIDVDDNAPEFPSTVPRPYILRLKEVIYRTGQQVELPKAVDKDIQPDHANIAYRLESHPEDHSDALDVFHLLVRNDSRLMLVLQRDLDYEDVKSYRFYLVAWSPRADERGRKSYVRTKPSNLQDKLEIRVEVLNINDIEPVFSQPSYKIEAEEGTALGTVIHILKATDRDENSTIRYSVEKGTDRSAADSFRVEPDGRVVLVKSLDYEKQRLFSFSVRASDGEFYALTRLEIMVIDENDEPPEYVTDPRNLTVEENLPSQTFVGNLLIIDRDSHEVNGQVSCQEPEQLAGKQPLLFFPETMEMPSRPEITATNLLLTQSGSSEQLVYQRFGLYTRVEFDREVNPTVHKSMLVCYDGLPVSEEFGRVTAAKTHRPGQPRLTSTLTISLTVSDQNDNPPEFEKQYYETELVENCPLGTRVIQVLAKDADSAPQARPRYSLLQNDVFASHFGVDTESGWIVTHADIDREIQETYQLTVLAIDGWDDPSREQQTSTKNSARRFTATTRVHIKILDENDNAPEFRGQRQFAVEENQPPNTWIADLQVVDRDDGPNGDVEFSLGPANKATQKEGKKDHEGTEKAKITTGTPPIRLLSNGSMYTTAILDRESQSHYCFEVTVKDKAPKKPLSSADTICVRLLDLNDNAPRFINIRGSSSDNKMNNTSGAVGQINNGTTVVPKRVAHKLEEPRVPVSVNEVPGYCALIAEAEDADEGRNAALRYAISKEDNKAPKTPAEGSHNIPDAFMMDAQSGRMMLARSLSAEELGVYKIILTVEDGGVPPQQAKQVVYLVIEDSPARGNWLFPDDQSGTISGTGDKGDYSEAHTILIVIILSGVSAFLAAVLISAILCMIKPFRRRHRGGRQAQFTKTSTVHLSASDKFILDQNGTLTGHPGSYDEYGMNVMEDAAYPGTLDDRNQHRGLLLTTAQIPGLDHLYLPPDKLIGVDTGLPVCNAVIDESNWPSGSAASTLMSSPLSSRMSSTFPLCQYNLTRPEDSSWSSTFPQVPVWNPMVSTAPLCDARSDNYVSSSNKSEYANCPSCSSHVPVIFTGGRVDEGRCADHILIDMAPTVGGTAMKFGGCSHSNSSAPSCQNENHIQTKTLKNSDMITAAGVQPSERNTTGEEQRSDSGRGASDEEASNQCPMLSHGNTFMLQTNGKFRSSTMRGYQENTAHVMSGLTFPSLPRIVPGSSITYEKNLTTFEPGRSSGGQISNRLEDTPTKVAMVRIPNTMIFKGSARDKQT
ncbi:unnamed protein product [Calicophoron daubneyi]|uniref:Cadherin domain-containing protein n=1 Tax=Calicophoron daubneyi TaxID=300641 RepID=A0AAV2T979_CALDB